MASTRSETSAALRGVRAGLLGEHGPTGADLRAALSDGYDRELRELFGRSAQAAPSASDGLALVAIGGLGRRDLAPFSDLDLVLVHAGSSEVAAVAEALWYPIWDSGVGLDHSVRTVPEARAVAERDVKAALGMLDARHVAGAEWLSSSLRIIAAGVWRARASAHLPAVAAAAAVRQRAAGELAFLLEPDLKESLGGLRDVVVLRALAAAQLVDGPSAEVLAARDLLLDVRGELHRHFGRGLDRLLQQEQGPVARAMHAAGLGTGTRDGDPDELLRAVSAAGRTIRYAYDNAWRSVDAELSRRGRRRTRRRPDRRPLADGVVEQDGEVVLARSAEPAWDGGLVLRAAAAAAENGLPLSPHTLARLAGEAPTPTVPWPDAVRDSFVRLLGTGSACVPVMEALDQTGLLSRLLPGWEHVRSRPQRNAVHRFTVDRHLVECVVEAAALTRRVARPDLLLLGALLHDIGKGYDEDHSVLGAEIAVGLGDRMGLIPGDVDVLRRLVRHHLLLPDTATRRDPDDPATVAAVAAAVGGSRATLELLHALSVADARATGPAAWSDWKATLISGLVDRVRAAMAGTPVPAADPLPEPARLAARMDKPTITPLLWPTRRTGLDGPAPSWRRRRRPAPVVRTDDPGPGLDDAPSDLVGEIVVVAPDAPGLLSRVAGLLAVHGLDVVTATVTTQRSKAVNIFRVSPRFGQVPDLEVLRGDFIALVEGRFPLGQRLAAAEQAVARPASGPDGDDVAVLWFDGQAAGSTVVEVRAADRVGLLHRLSAALESVGLDVGSARISTLGGSVVDAFVVRTADGGLVEDPALRAAAESAVRAAVAGRRLRPQPQD